MELQQKPFYAFFKIIVFRLLFRFNVYMFLFVMVAHMQVLMGLEYLHNDCHIIHTDIKPENIMFCVPLDYVKALSEKGTNSRSAGVLI